MNLNFGYVALYSMSRYVAKVGMNLMYIFSDMIYLSSMLEYV
jgi:hypothetical protein